MISVTQFHAGDATNIVPDQAWIGGTVRTFTVPVLDLIERRMEEVARAVATAFDCTIEYEFRRNYPPTINSEAETGFAATVATELVGPANVDSDVEPTMGAEDFSFMLQHKPAATCSWATATARTASPGTAWALHAAQPELRLQRRVAAGRLDLLRAAGGEMAGTCVTGHIDNNRGASAMGRSALDRETARSFARVAMDNVLRRYPYKVDHMMAGAGDVAEPATWHPVFCGSYDWHSSVHMHWLLVRLLGCSPTSRKRRASAKRWTRSCGRRASRSSSIISIGRVRGPSNVLTVGAGC